MFAKVRVFNLRVGLALMLLGLGLAALNLAQAQPPMPPPSAKAPDAPPPPPATAVAATVNGQPVLELSVYRGLLRENPKNWDAARKEVINYLVDNLLIDQYLSQLKIPLDVKEVEDRVGQIKAEAKKSGMEFEALLKRLHLTEEDLRRELSSALRWDKFVIQQGTDKVLQEMFEKNKNMFDGSQMKARHILLPLTGDNAPQIQAKLTGFKKQVEDEVAVELAKLPANTDNLTREKERMKLLDKTFAGLAMKESTCPSKAEGGDLGWFPRAGAMVEPFARAAFALKPYEMSSAVNTEFGCHLILAIDTKPGKEVKFDEVKPFVLEVYGERLREAIIANYKARSKIEIHALKK